MWLGRTVGDRRCWRRRRVAEEYVTRLHMWPTCDACEIEQNHNIRACSSHAGFSATGLGGGG